MARLKELYKNTMVRELMELRDISNVMKVPKIVKVTINMGIGEVVNDKKVMDNALKDLTLISGQKAIVTKARKSIAGFKIRQGWPLGCKVTLRGSMMYEFLDRLLSIVIPRIRDFRGLSRNSFDGRGNYNLGIKEQIVFPEIHYDKVDALRGLDISITTSAVNNEEGIALLEVFKFPFKNIQKR